MKLGVFLGSFDPMHWGHLRVIAQALASSLDGVLVVPAMHNPFKPAAPLDINLRAQIIQRELAHAEGHLAIDPTKITIDLIEQTLSPPYYSHITLRQLQTKYRPHQLCIISGADCHADVVHWTHGRQLLTQFPWYWYPRTAESSSQIRRRIAMRQPIDQLVPSSVAGYIVRCYSSIAKLS